MIDRTEVMPPVVEVPADDAKQHVLPLPDLPDLIEDDTPDQAAPFDPVKGYDESGGGEGLPVDAARARLRGAASA